MGNNFNRYHIKKSDIIKEIIFEYNDMLNNKSFINEKLNLVKLGSVSYSNLKFADKTKQDSVNKSLLDDINTAAKSVGIVATITTAKTGHSKTTKGSKRISRHMSGNGVDVAILNGMGSNGATNATNGSSEFRKLGFKIKDALVSMGYVWNTESGKDKAVLWHTNTGGNHYNHLHISNRTGSSSSAPSSDDESTYDENDDDKKTEVTKTDQKEPKKSESTKELSALDKLGLIYMDLAGIKPKEDKSTDDDEDSNKDEDSTEVSSTELKTTDTVKVSGFNIVEPSNEDKDFYIQVLEKINAPVTSQNLLFFYAWRQAEGAKATFNPFNTTHKTDNSTFWNCLKKKEGKCLGGVRNYESKTDGIEATAKTLTNGHYPCIVEKLKSNKGAVEIANCSKDLKTWGTRSLISTILGKKSISPPAISTSKVKSVNESLLEDHYNIKKLLY